MCFSHRLFDIRISVNKILWVLNYIFYSTWNIHRSYMLFKHIAALIAVITIHCLISEWYVFVQVWSCEEQATQCMNYICNGLWCLWFLLGVLRVNAGLSVIWHDADVDVDVYQIPNLPFQVYKWITHIHRKCLTSSIQDEAEYDRIQSLRAMH